MGRDAATASETATDRAVRESVRLLIVFIDLTRFWAQQQRADDATVAGTMDAFYVRAWNAVDATGRWDDREIHRRRRYSSYFPRR